MNELSLHILDIVQNSITANASVIQVTIDEDDAKDSYEIEIKDNGKGMSEEVLKEVSDPFFTSRTTRSVGLGISLFKQSAEQASGSLQINSEEGKGTILTAKFSHKHFDRPVLGDMAGTMTLLIGANPTIRFLYTHRTSLSDFEFDTKEVLEELEGTPINNATILNALKEMIEENLDMIGCSK
jgi:hypothetical protein